MAKYYFDIWDCCGLIPDDEGMELSDIAAARAEAILSVGDLMLADLRSGRPSNGRIEIVDHCGRMLDAMPVCRAVLH